MANKWKSSNVYGVLQNKNLMIDASGSSIVTPASVVFDGTLLVSGNTTLSGISTCPTADHTTNTTQIASTAYVKTVISDLINSAPSTLDTLNEIATALGNDPNFSTTIINSIALKAPKASPTFTGTITTPNIVIGNNVSIGTTYSDSLDALCSCNIGLSFNSVVNLHGTVNVGDGNGHIIHSGWSSKFKQIPEYYSAMTPTTDNQMINKKFITDSYTPTASLTKSLVGLGNVNNTTDLSKPISTATQTALDLKSNLSSPTFTGTLTTPNIVSTGNVTFGTDTTLCTINSSVIMGSAYNTQVYLNGSINIGDTTSTVIFNGSSLKFKQIPEYYSAMTPTTDYQLINRKFITDSYTPTASLTKTMVSLGNCDNTSDANKPVSTAQQNALNLKSNIESPTFTGTVTLPSISVNGVTITNTVLSYLSGVTSNIQSQISSFITNAMMVSYISSKIKSGVSPIQSSYGNVTIMFSSAFSTIPNVTANANYTTNTYCLVVNIVYISSSLFIYNVINAFNGNHCEHITSVTWIATTA